MNRSDDFPILANPTARGRRLIYLDNASTTQVPQVALDAMVDYYRSTNGNVDASYYELGGRATEVTNRIRLAFASFINAKSSEIVLTHSATEALNIIAYGWGLANIGAGDEIVLPISEHHSNMLPWQMIARRRGARLVFLNPDLNGCISDAELQEKITDKAKVVAVSHISHVFGTVYPLEKIAARAHEVGAITVFDCAQSIAHRKVDVVALGADFAVFSGHKAFAPAGTGFLFARGDLLAQMSPLVYGDGMEEEVGEWTSTFRSGFERFEHGNYDIAGNIGFVTTLRYLENVGYEEIEKRDHDLVERFLDGIKDNPSVKLYGNPCISENRCGIVAFNYVGLVPSAVAAFLDDSGIAVGAGVLGSRLLMGYLGTSAMCRASFSLYNTQDDVDELVRCLGNVQSQFMRRFMAT